MSERRKSTITKNMIQMRNNNPDKLNAYNHYHFDRTRRKDVLKNTSVGHPNLSVKLVGGVMVYIEPLLYPEKFYLGRWKLT